MKKNIKFILITLLLVAILCVSLVGCTNFKPLTGGNPNATTYNNNSLVVTQGDYIYFVNGKITLEDIAEKKDNKYGNVVKSAIYRAKKDGSDAQVVVPQVAMDSNNSNGISVLGNYIYFTSPSTATGKDGSLLKNNTDFYRVEISGKNLKKLTTLEGNTNAYKFTDKGLIYLENSKLTYLPYNGKAKVITESATGNYFPVTTTYTPNKADATMAVYFTESPEENDGDPYNILKCITPSGEVKTILDGKKNKETYTLKNVQSENDGTAAVYYEKAVYNKESVNKGLMGIKVNSNCAKTNDPEKQFAGAGATVRYIDYATGVYIFEDNKMFIPVIEDGIVSLDKFVESYPIYTSESGSLSSSDIFTIREEKVNDETKKFMYFFDSNGLNKVEMIKEENRMGVAVIVIEKDIVTDYVKPILDGNTFYYINSGYYNYIYKVDITLKEDENGEIVRNKHSIVGVRTNDDKKAYIKLVKDMDEDVREAHDKLIKEDLPADSFKK